MKLDYEKLRLMADLGHGASGKDRMTVKNKKGVALKPLIVKWEKPASTRSMSMGMVQPLNVHMGSPSPLCLAVGSFQGPHVPENPKRGSR